MIYKKINNKGITLIALIITIVVMLIIIGVTVNTSLNALNKTKLRGFYTQLEYVQKRIDDIASTNESYINSNGNKVYLKEQGTVLKSAQKTNLQNILNTEGMGLGLSVSTFRYFTKEQLESVLGLSDIDYDVFVDFNSRTVIAEDGIKIGGKTYHILKNSVYFVDSNFSSDKEKVAKLEFDITTYGRDYYSSIMINTDNTMNTTNTMVLIGEDNYRILVTAYNGNNRKLEGGILKYKKTTNKYWETATNMEITISDLGEYNIEYQDNNKKKISAVIKIWINGYGDPMISII